MSSAWAGGMAPSDFQVPHLWTSQSEIGPYLERGQNGKFLPSAQTMVAPPWSIYFRRIGNKSMLILPD